MHWQEVRRYPSQPPFNDCLLNLKAEAFTTRALKIEM
jgi:hypothetical protein